MKFIADENIEGELVDWLVNQGHDVGWIAKKAAGLDDPRIAAMTVDEARYLVTRDKDFGTLAFRDRRHIAGVLLLRTKGMTLEEVLKAIKELWPEIEWGLPGGFLVLSKEKLRGRSLP